MVDFNYRPRTLQQKFGWVVEECGEVMAAIGKTLRWGLHSVNPELPPEQQEKNVDWVLRELGDLIKAIDMLKHELYRRQHRGASEVPEIPPLDPVETYAQNVRLKSLIQQHIYSLPKPAADEWQKLLDKALHGDDDDSSGQG